MVPQVTLEGRDSHRVGRMVVRFIKRLPTSTDNQGGECYFSFRIFFSQWFALAPRSSVLLSLIMHMETKELRKTSDAVNAAFFPALSRTMLLVYELNPYRMHASWHINRSDYLKAGREAYTLVLRFYDLSAANAADGLPISFEIPVEGITNNWYVDLPAPAETLIADLGMLNPAGDFLWLATSNMVQIPPACPSPLMDLKTILAGAETGPDNRSGDDLSPTSTALPDIEEFTNLLETDRLPSTAAQHADGLPVTRSAVSSYR
ncbi:MAG: DUF4912 domain-containing protein [Spartobacteria bacterium]|nr:DUF4912 domain-containing protein [Spartobacteria bacterium]